MEIILDYSGTQMRGPSRFSDLPRVPECCFERVMRRAVQIGGDLDFINPMLHLTECASDPVNRRRD